MKQLAAISSFYWAIIIMCAELGFIAGVLVALTRVICRTQATLSELLQVLTSQ